MARTKKEKKVLIDLYENRIKQSKAVVIVRNKGVTASEAVAIKQSLYDFDTKFNVIKNTLFKIALKNTELEGDADLDNYEHAAVFIKEDIVNSSKALKKFADELKDSSGSQKLELAFGYLDGVKLSKEQVTELAEMPDKQGSISMILGILDQALSSVVNVLEDPVRSYATIIDQAFKE